MGLPCALCGQTVSDQAHLLACQVPRRGGATQRHDAVKNLVARMAKDALVSVMVEPFRHAESRFDLWFTSAGFNRAIDVTIVHPTCSTHVRASSQGLSAADRAEKRKLQIEGQQRLAQRIGAELAPFGAETFGAIGPMARDTLRQVAAAADHTDINGVELLQAVSVAIVKGNWRLLEQAVGMLIRRGSI